MAVGYPEDRRTAVTRGEGRIGAAAWGFPFVTGLLLLILGVVAAISSGITGVASVLLFGGILAAAGIIEIIGAFRARGRGSNHSLAYVLGGIFALLVGIFFLARPLVGLGALTLLLGAYFLVNGLFSGITSLMDRYPAWGWDLVHGVIAIVLGIAIFRSWPVSSLVIVGLFVGIEIALRGITMMAASLAARRILRTPNRQVTV